MIVVIWLVIDVVFFHHCGIYLTILSYVNYSALCRIKRGVKMNCEDFVESIEKRLAFVSVIGTSNYVKALANLKRYRSLRISFKNQKNGGL